MSKAKLYVKKPIEIMAIQWDGNNISDVLDFMKTISRYAIRESNGSDIEGDIYSFRGNELYIKTLEGEMKANVGDFVIKGVKGEFYPCKPDIFEATYDCVEKNKVIDDLPIFQRKFIHIDIKSEHKSLHTKGLTYSEIVGLLRTYEAHFMQKALEEIDGK